MKESKSQPVNEKPELPTSKPTCGIVMPITVHPPFVNNHWIDVRSILDSAIDKAGFVPRLVSDAAAIGIIHARIATNLYKDPIIVCDVSGHNPNVMLELGIRLALKPVVIVKDDQTPFTFDTAPIEHLEYPRDLRHGKIEEFKDRLADSIRATYDQAEEHGYKSFLQSFAIKVPELQTQAVSPSELALDEIRDHLRLISRRVVAPTPTTSFPGAINHLKFTFPNGISSLELDGITRIFGVAPGFIGGNNYHISLPGSVNLRAVASAIRRVAPSLEFRVQRTVVSEDFGSESSSSSESASSADSSEE